MAYNTQVSYYTTGGTFIQISSPSGTGGGIVSLYQKLLDENIFIS